MLRGYSLLIAIRRHSLPFVVFRDHSWSFVSFIYSWFWVVFRSDLWFFVVIHRYSSSFVVIRGQLKICTVIHRHLWLFAIICRHSWSFEVIRGHSRSFVRCCCWIIHPKEYYCWSINLLVAILLLVSLIVLLLFASRCGTALGPSWAFVAVRLRPFKTWVKLLFLTMTLLVVVTDPHFFQHL